MPATSSDFDVITGPSTPRDDRDVEQQTQQPQAQRAGRPVPPRTR